MTSLVLAAVIQTTLAATGDQTFQVAYQRSVKTGRPLVVLLGAPWCPGCVQMKNRILPQVAQTGALQKVEFVYVDVDQQPELANRLSRAESIPQLLRFEKTDAGWQARLLSGAKSVEQVSAFIEGRQPTPRSGLPSAVERLGRSLVGADR